jgi:hypothetical protein
LALTGIRRNWWLAEAVDFTAATYYSAAMRDSVSEWNIPKVEALTQADGSSEDSQVTFRNGLSFSV